MGAKLDFYKTALRNRAKIFEAIFRLTQSRGVHRVAMPEEILGCPPEEGIDYAEGESCPDCPFWAKEANEALQVAVANNPRVPKYLRGRKRMPRDKPSHYGIGSIEEAVVYTELYSKCCDNGLLTKRIYLLIIPPSL